MKSFLVTGANSGLGLDACRQLALRKDVEKVYMACRSNLKAAAAIDEIIGTSGGKIKKTKLQYVNFDACTTKEDIAKISSHLPPLDGLILNAGGIGHDVTRKPSGPNNVMEVYQMNVIGHIQLVDILDKAGLLKTGARIVYAGSEAARGVSVMGIANPPMGDTAEWYRERITGEAPHRFDSMAMYASVKGVAALYWAAWARRHTDYTVLTVSPGGTSGTGGAKAKAVPFHLRVMMPIMMPMMTCMGVMHPVEVGTERYIRALMNESDMAGFASGTFVASRVRITGNVCDQTELRPGRKYGDEKKQEAAFELLSTYV